MRTLAALALATLAACGGFSWPQAVAEEEPQAVRRVTVLQAGPPAQDAGRDSAAHAMEHARGVVAIAATVLVEEDGVLPVDVSALYLVGAAEAAADDVQSLRVELLAAGYGLRTSGGAHAHERPQIERRAVRVGEQRAARSVDVSFAPETERRVVAAPVAEPSDAEENELPAGVERWAVPVEEPRITSRYGPRIDPITGQPGRMHRGTDFGHPTGTPVYAPASGRVLMAGWCTAGTGNCVVMEHTGGWRTQYFHLSRVRTRSGTEVAQGERIGDIGSTGRSTGPHLHFQMSRGGVDIDPETAFGTPVQ